jgi:hypothetical protein
VEDYVEIGENLDKSSLFFLRKSIALWKTFAETLSSPFLKKAHFLHFAQIDKKGRSDRR